MQTLEVMPVRVRAAAAVRKAIYAGEYAGGDELSLTDVAARLGISRTPVREAFQELAAEGLITLRMNRGAVVNAIDRKFVRDIFETRALLEAEAAARAARSGMDAEPLLTRVKDLRERLDTCAPAEYEELNQELHMAIWTASDNHQMQKYLMEMWNGPSIGRGQDAALRHWRESTEEHIQVLEAILRRDPPAARAAMRKHIERSMENMLEHYGESGKSQEAGMIG